MLTVTLLVLFASRVLRVIGVLVSCLLLFSLEASGLYAVGLLGTCIFRMESKILMGKTVWSSLRWLLEAASLWM
jgi:hypothetical protein